MQLNKQSVKQLYPGIKVIKKIQFIQKKLTYLLYLEIMIQIKIDFIADFTGSKSITINGLPNQFIVQKTVNTIGKLLIAEVYLHEGWKITTKFKYQIITQDAQTIHKRLSQIKQIFQNVDIQHTSVMEITSILVKSNIKFIDRQFPPISTSFRHFNELDNINIIQWKRLNQILPHKKLTLLNKISLQNSILGKVHNKAFYSVLFSLSFHPALILRLFIENQINDYGIYRLQFCINGLWRQVTIDDYIPCFPQSGLKFILSKTDDIWMILVEKGYAKFYKQYDILRNIQVANVFSDLTGCPTQTVSTNSIEIKNIILYNLKQKYIVAFVNNKQDKQGHETIIYQNFAYVISGYRQKQNKIYFQYLGDSNKQYEIEETLISKIFSELCICKVGNWEQVRLKGKFTKIEASEDSTNQIGISLSKWYYDLQVNQDSDINICLHQEDAIQKRKINRNYLNCSLMILQKSNQWLKPKIICDYQNKRQIKLNIKLSSGNYIIVPFVNSNISQRLQDHQSQIEAIFQKIQFDNNNLLSYNDLASFYKVMNQNLTQIQFYDLINTYGRYNNGISLSGFVRMCKDNNTKWKDYLKYYQNQRLFTLSFHSTKRINVLVKSNIGTELNSRAHCEIINQKGTQLQLSNQIKDIINVKYLSKDSDFIEYMIQNMHYQKIEASIDCTESFGFLFIPKLGKGKYMLQPNQKEIVMKLIPIPSVQSDALVRKQKIKVKVCP